MQSPSFKDYMIASAVWYYLERGYDISEIVQRPFPEFEFPDLLYSVQPKDIVESALKKAVRMTVVPASADSAQSPALPKISIQKACGAFFDKDDPRKESHVYFKDRRIQMELPVPYIQNTGIPEIDALIQYHFMLKDIRHLIEDSVCDSFRTKCRNILSAAAGTTSPKAWSLPVISALDSLYVYADQNDNADMMHFTVKLFSVLETEFLCADSSACIRHSCYSIKQNHLFGDCTGQNQAATEVRDSFLKSNLVDIVHNERSTCRSCVVNPCPFRDLLGTKLKEYNKSHPQNMRLVSSDKYEAGNFPGGDITNKIKPYLDALVKADMITSDYKWIKGNGHTNYEAAYAAHIIHLTVRSIPQNAIGNLFGIKSISTYLGRLDTKESIKKPIEDIFRTAGLKINTK